MGYSLVALVAVVSILCTLTRSSLLGLLAAFLFLGILLFRHGYRSLLLKTALASVGIVILVLLFPGTPVLWTPSPVGYFKEMLDAFMTGGAYGPWHQRLLVWMSAWDMVKGAAAFRGRVGMPLTFFILFFRRNISLIRFFPLGGPTPIMPTTWLWRFGPRWERWVWCAALCCWRFVLMKGLRVIREKTDRSHQLPLMGLLAGSMGMVVENFFGNVSMFIAMPAFLFCWNLGSLYNEAGEPGVFRRSSRNPGSFVLLVVMWGFFIFSAGYYLARWNQERHAFEGIEYTRHHRPEAAVKALEEARAWFPWNLETNYELGNSYVRYGEKIVG